MEALWSRGSVNHLCIPVLSTTRKKKPYTTNYKGKDKFAIAVFLCDIYSKELVVNSDIQTKIIWSDGPASVHEAFMNQFMKQLIEDLALQYKKKVYLNVFCNFPW